MEQFPVFDAPVFVGVDSEVLALRIRDSPDRRTVLKVTTTESLSVARKWVRKMKHRERSKIGNLKVGFSFHGQILSCCVGTRVLTLNLGGFEEIGGAFQVFLAERKYTFLGLGAKPARLQITNYNDVSEQFEGGDAPVRLDVDLVPQVFGENHNLQIPAVGGANNWDWPLTPAEIIYSSLEAYVLCNMP